MSTKRRRAKLLSILMIAAMLLTYNSSIPMAVWAANEAEPEVSEEQKTPETGAVGNETADPAESQAGANDSDLEEENADNAYEEKGEDAEKSEAAEAKTDAEAAEEEKDAGPADKKTEYVYSDKQIKVTATLSDPSAVPDEAELVVTPVTKDTDGYNYDAYMAALNKGSEESSYTDDNTLLYDIAFIVDEDGKKTEVQPAEGKVSIKAEFLKKQLTESIGAEKADEVKLVHLPLSDEIAGSVDTTAAATDIKASDIKIENVDADVTVGKKQEATFTTDSLSVWAVYDVDTPFAGITASITFKSPSGQNETPSFSEYAYLIASVEKGETTYFAVTEVEKKATTPYTLEASDFKAPYGGAAAAEEDYSNLKVGIYTSASSFTSGSDDYKLQSFEQYFTDVSDLGEYHFAEPKKVEDTVVFTGTRLEKADYTVDIKTQGMTGSPEALDPSVRDRNYYVLARLTEAGKDDTLAYQIKPVAFGESTSVSVTFNADDYTKYIDENQTSSEKQSYYPARHDVKIRLYSTDGQAITSYGQIVKNEGDVISDIIEGYSFSSDDQKENNKTVLTIKKDLTKKYNVNVEYDDGTSIEDSEYYYIYVESKHASTGTTYYLRRLTNTGDKSEDQFQDLGSNDNPWDKADGKVKVTDPFTGNETVTLRILKADGPLSIDDAIKEKNCKIVSSNKTRSEETNEEEMLTTVTDTIRFRKTLPQASNDYTYQSVLGNATNFGIVADTYNQTDHAQTNFATNNYNGNTYNFQPDLSNNPGKVLITNLNGNLQLGDKSRRDFGSVEIQIGNKNGNKIQDDSQDGNFIDGDSEAISNAVNSMIEYGREKSKELAAKDCNYYPPLPDSNGNVTIDTTDYPDNVTIYIDADRIQSAIAKTEGLTINKKDGQTLVFNFKTKRPVTIGKFKATLNGTVYDTTSPVDSGTEQNRAVDQIARHIIWNVPNSKSVKIQVTTGVFLVPDSKATVKVDGTSSGWILTGGTFTHASGEFHNVYQNMPETEEIDTDAGRIEIEKTLAGGAVNQLTNEQKNAITFTVTGPNDYSKTFTYKDMEDGKKILYVPVGNGYTVTETNTAVEGVNVSSTYQVGDAEASTDPVEGLTVEKNTRRIRRTAHLRSRRRSAEE